MYSERDKKYNLKYKKKLDAKINMHGQSFTIVRNSPGERCPCYNVENGYGNLEWHRHNPKEPECDTNCYLESKIIKLKDKAFIIPAKAMDSTTAELILTTIGNIKKDDYIYIGKSDVDIFTLKKDIDYLIYNNRKWVLLNPDIYKIGDVDLVYIAILSLIKGVDYNV